MGASFTWALFVTCVPLCTAARVATWATERRETRTIGVNFGKFDA